MSQPPEKPWRRRQATLLALAALAAVSAAADGPPSPNRGVAEAVTVTSAGLDDGSEVYNIDAEIFVATACDELENLGTLTTLWINGQEIKTKSSVVLSHGNEPIAACSGHVPDLAAPDPCGAASPCTSFFPNSPGEPLFPACELHEGITVRPFCQCTARIPLTFHFVALVPGDEVTISVAPAPTASAPEVFAYDDFVSFRFTGEGVPGCVGSGRSLCLWDGRFRVEVDRRDFDGNPGPGWATAASRTSGYFWFFQATDMEVAVKVLDGRALNGYWWVFLGALTNVEYALRVTDTSTGEVRTYVNPAGEFTSGADLRAFGDGMGD